jgi:hypothetical protein
LTRLKESLHHSKKNRQDLWAYPLPPRIPCLFMLVVNFVIKVWSFAPIQSLSLKFCCQRKWWENIVGPSTSRLIAITT